MRVINARLIILPYAMPVIPARLTGYYPAGVRGVGVPGAMFVLSTEDWFGATWCVADSGVAAGCGRVPRHAEHDADLRSLVGAGGLTCVSLRVRTLAAQVHP